MVFVSRCQNLKGEYNDRPWAGKINDGSFIYSAASGGDTKVDRQATAETGLPGYGSMTYAGIKSLIYCGVAKDDPRIKKAYEWIQKNYTLDKNPGMPRSPRGVGPVTTTTTRWPSAWTCWASTTSWTAKGIKHDWRADLTAALAKRQQPDGSFVNNANELDGRRPQPGHRLRPDGPELLPARQLEMTAVTWTAKPSPERATYHALVIALLIFVLAPLPLKPTPCRGATTIAQLWCVCRPMFREIKSLSAFLTASMSTS